jgi:hypothetical protein
MVLQELALQRLDGLCLLVIQEAKAAAMETTIHVVVVQVLAATVVRGEAEIMEQMKAPVAVAAQES